jgi:hypothetical protein
MEDLGFHERWLVLDAILRRPCSHLGEYSVQHCSRKGTVNLADLAALARTDRGE